jgi:hypothetical protein
LSRPETQPPPATPPSSAPVTQPSAPAPQPTPTVPKAEGQVELPPAPAPRVPPTPAPTAPRTTQPPITAAEGAASPGAEEAIRDLVRRYAQALESRNVDALKRIWPALQEDAMRREFQQARRIEVDIDNTTVNVSGNSATVSFTRRYRVSTVDGQRLDTNSRTTMSVRRAGTEWVIDRVRFEGSR